VLRFWVIVVSGYPAIRVRTRFPLIEIGFSRIEDGRRGRKMLPTDFLGFSRIDG